MLDDVGWTAVPDAEGADVIVVREDDAWALATETSAEPVEALDPTRRLWRVQADGPLEPLAGEGERAFDIIAVALAAESVGVAQRAMDMAVAYAKEREQFGRPIGAYQAVSHACAQMLLEVEGARSTVLYAAWALDDEPESGPLAASMAKAYASDAGWRVPAAALQVHGGIGFTWEHDLHLWLKRGKANAYLWGDARSHRDAGGDAHRPGLTSVAPAGGRWDAAAHDQGWSSGRTVALCAGALLAAALAPSAGASLQASVDAGGLVLTDVAGSADDVTLSNNKTGLFVALANKADALDPVCPLVSPKFHGFQCAPAPLVRIDTGAGDDSIDATRLTTPLAVTLGPGSDVLQAGSGNDTVATVADGQRDVVDCGAGQDTVEGMADPNDELAATCRPPSAASNPRSCPRR